MILTFQNIKKTQKNIKKTVFFQTPKKHLTTILSIS